jgi:septal ring factor EnvC (AmiA/AmiB activator)
MPTIVSPAYGMPMGLPMQPDPGFAQPAAKRRVAVPILASLLALFVLASGVLAAFYVDKNSKLTKSQDKVALQSNTIATQDQDLKDTKQKLQDKADELAKAQQDLRGTQNDNAQNKHDKEVIGQCLTLLIQALAAANNGDKTTAQQKIAAMDAPCKEAQTILGGA